MRKTFLSTLSLFGLLVAFSLAAHAQCATVAVSFPATVSTHQRVTGTLMVANCSSARELVGINLTVVNETTGFTIFRIRAGSADLAAGESRSRSVSFNTATATPGEYSVTATAMVGGVVVASDTLTFTVT